MTKITIDRAIVEQALEVLESLQGGCTDSDDGTVEAVTVWCPEVISALRSALAEPMQDWDEIEALRGSLREHMAEIHRLRAELAAHIGGANEMVTTEPVNLLHTRWCPEVVAALRASMAQQAEPVGKVTETSDSAFKVEFTKFLDAGTNLYTTTPQRKPLTDEEIHDCFQQSGKTKAETRRRITRAIERAHGIGANNE